jgi:1,4-alpha-glucan branching enzyme
MSRHPGAATTAPRTTQHTITLEAPGAASVAVTGSFCDWAPAGRPLKRDSHGLWTIRLALPPGEHEYRFLVDGEWANDPGCAERVPNPFGSDNCVLRV